MATINEEEKMNQRSNKPMYVGLCALVILMLTVGGAWADSSGRKNYGRVSLGMNDVTGDLDDAGYDEGVAVGVTYGRYLTKNLVIEGGINYFHTNQDISGSTTVAGRYTREDNIFVSALSATLKGEFPLGPVRFYGGAGVGGYFVSLNTDIETSSLGSFDEDDDDVVFGAHAVAGAYYDITPRIFAGIEGMYRWTGDIDILKNVGTVPVEVDGNLNGYVVSVSAGFRF
jgi:opacity protein-like surface antigen